MQGEYSIDCVYEPVCNCEGEVWIDETCKSGFVCSGPATDSGVNPGSYIECGAEGSWISTAGGEITCM